MAPTVDGEFQLTVTLVQELVAWFDMIDPANACYGIVQVGRERDGNH